VESYYRRWVREPHRRNGQQQQQHQHAESSSITGLAPSAALTAAGGPGGIALTIGALISKNNQLLGVLNASESRGKSRVISAPSIIATDSIPATMNVGNAGPVLSSQGITSGVQSVAARYLRAR